MVLGSAAACSAPPLADAQPSAEALARAVVAAVEQRDEAALRRLAISEEEFRDQVWPELPAARRERNMPVEYVWGDLRQKSDGGLRSVLAEYGGRRYTFVSLRFDGDSTDYAGYRVHRAAVFIVRSGSDSPIELRLCGSILEKGGRWKVFSYVVDS